MLSKLKMESNIGFEDMTNLSTYEEDHRHNFRSFQNYNFIAYPKHSEGSYLFSFPFHTHLANNISITFNFNSKFNMRTL